MILAQLSDCGQLVSDSKCSVHVEVQRGGLRTGTERGGLAALKNILLWRHYPAEAPIEKSGGTSVIKKVMALDSDRVRIWNR